MGEGLKNQPTACLENSELLLRDETFSELSTLPNGLSLIPQEEILNFIYTMDNPEDIIYAFKFLSNKEYFSHYTSGNGKLFENLDQESEVKVKNLADILHKTFSKESCDKVTFYEDSEIKLNEEGPFIAYINSEEKRLDLSWKSKSSKAHIFQELLKKFNASERQYPKELRSRGYISIFLDSEDFLNVEFYGDARKGAPHGFEKYLNYAPGYLEMCKEEITEFFKEKYQSEDIKVHF